MARVKHTGKDPDKGKGPEQGKGPVKGKRFENEKVLDKGGPSKLAMPANSTKNRVSKPGQAYKPTSCPGFNKVTLILYESLKYGTGKVSLLSPPQS